MWRRGGQKAIRVQEPLLSYCERQVDTTGWARLVNDIVMGGSTIVQRGCACSIVTSDDVTVRGGRGDGDNGVNAGAASIFRAVNAGLFKTCSPNPRGKSWSWSLSPTGNWSSFTADGVAQTLTYNNANEIKALSRKLKLDLTIRPRGRPKRQPPHAAGAQ